MQSILWDYLNSLKGKKIAVIGMGVSNAPLVKKMLQAGLTVRVCDKREREDFDGLSELESKGLKVSLGPNYLDGLEGADVIFRTPGVRPDLPQIAKAVEAGAELTSEMEPVQCHCSHRLGRKDHYHHHHCGTAEGGGLSHLCGGQHWPSAAVRRGRNSSRRHGGVGAVLLPADDHASES